MKSYAVIYEWAGTNYSAYVPDLAGCISTGRTREEIEANIAEAIQLYVDTLIEDGKPVPEPTTDVGKVEVAA
jgi:predicted RNase H-like HicB family nuclease